MTTQSRDVVLYSVTAWAHMYYHRRKVRSSWFESQNDEIYSTIMSALFYFFKHYPSSYGILTVLICCIRRKYKRSGSCWSEFGKESNWHYINIILHHSHVQVTWQRHRYWHGFEPSKSPRIRIVVGRNCECIYIYFCTRRELKLFFNSV